MKNTASCPRNRISLIDCRKFEAERDRVYAIVSGLDSEGLKKVEESRVNSGVLGIIDERKMKTR